MKKVDPTIPEIIRFGDAALEYLGALLNSRRYSSEFVLVDDHTAKWCLPAFLQRFPDFPFIPIEIPAGEAGKNVHTLTRVWQHLIDEGGDRSSLLINLGGGVVTDLGGFAASTFKRGIDFVHVPTSLLAMVDAAIGGKNGVDLGNLKNQVGVIRPPLAICIFPEFLSTLPEREIISGKAEMYKHGLIASREHWNSVKNLQGTPETRLIKSSAQIKSEVVASDPDERGWRKILNFGHTLGHAIESYFLSQNPDDPFLHGEAIACGMILEAYLSHKVLGLAQTELEEISQTLTLEYPKIPIKKTDYQHIESFMFHDKKNVNGEIRFVLLRSIEQPVPDIAVPLDEWREAFSYYGHL